MLRFALVLLLFASGPLRAESTLFPAYYSVTGVAADDVLNLRARPDAGAGIVGTLPPNGSKVEIVELSPDGKWGHLANGEADAWASMRFLKRAPGQEDKRLPLPLACSGTEPFWALRLGTDETVFDELGGERVPLKRIWAGPSEGRGGLFFGLHLESAEGAVDAVISRRVCFDDMSDAPYGFSVSAVLSGDMGNRLMVGCCSLP